MAAASTARRSRALKIRYCAISILSPTNASKAIMEMARMTTTWAFSRRVERERR